MNKYLTAYGMKWLAMVAMVLDHVAWAFLADNTWLAESLHFVGRLVAPLMCYFLAVGFYHTKDYWAYLGRLLGFAVVSQVAFYAFIVGVDTAINEFDWVAFVSYGNVLFSLAFALIALKIYTNSWQAWQKALAIVALYPLVSFCDYGFAMIAMTLLFYHFYRPDGTRLMPMLTTYVLSLPVMYVLIYGFEQTVGLGFMHFGMLLTALVIYAHNGKKGSNTGGRYLFYVFYPVHLLVIACLQALVLPT